MKKQLRILLLLLLEKSGIFAIWRYLHRYEIIILMVHGVMTPEDTTEWQPLRERICPQILEKTLKNLSLLYNFISLDDALDMINGITPVQPYSIVLTFDDGYRNNLTHALPVLMKYNAPATFYLVGGNTENKVPFWFDRLDYALQHISSPSMKLEIGGESVDIDNSSRENLTDSFAKFRNVAKGIYLGDLEMLRVINELILAIEKKTGKSLLDVHADDNWSAIMNWEEAKFATASGLITIGSHSVDHISLNMVDKEMAKDQMERSKVMVEKMTGVSCKHFCYPSGDWNQEVAEIAKQCGYQSAVTTVPGTNRVGNNPYCLRRINVPVSGNDIEILASVTGFWPSVMRLNQMISNRSESGKI